MTTNREVWDELTHVYRCRIFAGWFLAQDNKMVQLDQERVGELADRHLCLTFDVYGPSADSDTPTLNRAEGTNPTWELAVQSARLGVANASDRAGVGLGIGRLLGEPGRVPARRRRQSWMPQPYSSEIS